MIKIGKICLLTEGEIAELNKRLDEIESNQGQFAFDLARNAKDHEKMRMTFGQYAMEDSSRIGRMADIIMPTLPIAKRKALAKLFDGKKKAVGVVVTGCKQSDDESTKTESK